MKRPSRPPVTRISLHPGDGWSLEEARTALHNWLLARVGGGECRLRVRGEGNPVALDQMARMGLECGGEPLLSAEGRNRHREAVRELLDGGRAVADEDGSVRFVPPPGQTMFEDLVRWEVLFGNEEVGPFLVEGPDGEPAPDLEAVCDDARMGVTHVLRPEAKLEGSCRRILLCRALGLEPPVYGHLPRMRGASGLFLEEEGCECALAPYLELGVLPGALADHLGPAGEGTGPRDLEEIATAFDPEVISRKPSVFDTMALVKVSRLHLERLGTADLAGLCRPMLEAGMAWREEYGPGGERRDWFLQVLDLARPGAQILLDVVGRARPFLFEQISWDADAVRGQLKETPLRTARLVGDLHERLAGLGGWSGEKVTGRCEDRAEGALLSLALTGSADFTDLGRAAELLGRESALARLEALRAFLEHDPEAQQALRSAGEIIPPPE